MSFITFTFAGLFLPALILYYLLPGRFRWILLLLASLGFYTLSGITALAVLLVSWLAVWVCGRAQEAFPRRRNPAVWTGILFLLLLWSRQKWNHLSVLGFSFYLLQAAGYLLDVKNRVCEAERNPFRLLLFLSFFPLSVQGPICRYGEFETLVKNGVRQSSSPEPVGNRLKAGIGRMLWGYFKKLVIADRIALFTGVLFGAPDTFRGLSVLMALSAYTVQLYADFTGGIDIALGTACCFGIVLPENFDRPFSSRNLSEYWRRWHITLGTWFRDYVFYPLSLSLPGTGTRFPLFAATLLTWSLTGLWHGLSARYLLWGLSNGMILLLSQELTRRRRGRKQRPKELPILLQTAWVFLLTSLLRAFDCYGSAGEALRQLGSLFRPSVFFSGPVFQMTGRAAFPDGASLFGLFLPGLRQADLWLLAAALLPVAVIVRKSGGADPSVCFLRLTPAARTAFYALLVIAILLFGIYGTGYDASGFIYGNFV